MIFYCHYPRDEYSGSSDKLRQRRSDPHLQASVINKASKHACQCINIFSEDQGYLVNQDIADHTAESPRNCPHHNSHPHRKPECQRLLDTDHTEQSQPDGIENEESIVQANHIFPEYDNKVPI